ncbi:hypothetical protein [Nonomuraea polychroma]|uniref:hypothetical protein n=1 Tax=Nonomuraea polychroma TaxID=46176 RepID=UPI0013E3CE52|nr:hypothetical protein [Nonomuraea polychroma]
MGARWAVACGAVAIGAVAIGAVAVAVGAVTGSAVAIGGESGRLVASREAVSGKPAGGARWRWVVDGRRGRAVGCRRTWAADGGPTVGGRERRTGAGRERRTGAGRERR